MNKHIIYKLITHIIIVNGNVVVVVVVVVVEEIDVDHVV